MIQRFLQWLRGPDLLAARVAAISLIRDAGEISGRDLRKALAAEGHRFSMPAFYQFMASLEDRGSVRSKCEPREVLGHAVLERRYRLTY